MSLYLIFDLLIFDAADFTAKISDRFILLGYNTNMAASIDELNLVQDLPGLKIYEHENKENPRIAVAALPPDIK